MVQAACSGAIDFAHSAPRDPRWWRKLVLLTNALDRKNLIRICEGYNRCDLATLAMEGLSNESVEKFRKATTERTSTIARALRPWQYKDKDETNVKQELKHNFDQLYALWVKRWGDPNDPKTKANIQATVDALNRDNLALRRNNPWAPMASSR